MKVETTFVNGISPFPIPDGYEFKLFIPKKYSDANLQVKRTIKVRRYGPQHAVTESARAVLAIVAMFPDGVSITQLIARTGKTYGVLYKMLRLLHYKGYITSREASDVPNRGGPLCLWVRSEKQLPAK